MDTKTVLITGASSGFGRMIAEALARAGHTVHASIDNAVADVLSAASHIDVVVHKAGHMVYGPAEAFTSGTNHFAHAGAPDDGAVVAEYEAGPYAGFGPQVQEAFNSIVPPAADPAAVAADVVDVVGAPFGSRPFRVHIDPSGDGADVGFAVLDRLKAEMLYRVGLSDLLAPTRKGAN